MPDASITPASLAHQSHWDDVWSDIPPSSVPTNDQLTEWLQKFIPEGHGKSFFEVGCYPGGYTSFFGSMGYKISGIDLTPKTSDLQIELSKKYSVGKIINGDWTLYQSQERYDVVASFGFIEHFVDWKSQIIKQSEMVEKNGLLIIETPNLDSSFLQKCYQFTDPAILSIHVKDSMNPNAWKEILIERNFEILWAGHFGKFIYWMTNMSPTIIQKVITASIIYTSPILSRLGSNSKILSPYCGLIARRL